MITFTKNRMAKALGVDRRTISKMLEDGRVIESELIPRMSGQKGKKVFVYTRDLMKKLFNKF